MESKMEKFMDVMSLKMSQQDEAQIKMEQMICNHSSLIYNLEVQIGQLANSLATRNQDALPSNTEKNPKEQVKAITLRSSIEIQTPKAIMEYKEKKNEREQDDERAEILKEPEVKEENKAKLKAPSIQLYEPPVPYPQRLKKKKHD